MTATRREGKMKQAVKVTTTGKTEIIDLDSAPGELSILQSAVGGWVEATDVVGDMTIWLNEEGRMHGLSANPLATKYFEKTNGTGYGNIVGDVVFTGLTDGEGQTTSLTVEQVAELVHTD